MTIEENLAAARVKMKAMSNDKDKYLEKYRAKARALTDEIDAFAAQLVAESAVAGMSEAQQQAVAVELAKVGDA